jgi:hypothetical protein
MDNLSSPTGYGLRSSMLETAKTDAVVSTTPLRRGGLD